MAYGGPGGAKCAGTWSASAAGVMDLSESFFEPLGEALLNRKTSDSKGSVNGQGG